MISEAIPAVGTITRIQYGSLDIEGLKGIKPLNLDLNGLWSQVTRCVTPRIIPNPLRGYDSPIMPYDQPFLPPEVRYNLSPEAALRAGGRIWSSNDNLPAATNRYRGLPNAGLLLAVCDLGSKLDENDWNNLISGAGSVDDLKDLEGARVKAMTKFRSPKVSQFVFAVNVYERVKYKLVEDYDPKNEIGFRSRLTQMQQDIMQALR